MQTHLGARLPPTMISIIRPILVQEVVKIIATFKREIYTLLCKEGRAESSCFRCFSVASAQNN